MYKQNIHTQKELAEKVGTTPQQLEMLSQKEKAAGKEKKR